MQISQVQKKYQDIEIELLLAFVLKKPKEFVFLHPEYNLKADQLKRLQALINRRQKGEPIAYLLGYKDFYGLRFKVNKHVLIPRPETEWLVERAIQHATRNIKLETKKIQGFKLHATSFKILDLGTGSGCIAISLACQLAKLDTFKNQVSITASDISKKALSVARHNSKTLFQYSSDTPEYQRNIEKNKTNSSIRFLQSDLFQNLAGKFDIIAANLPYVPTKHMRRFVLKQRPTRPNDLYAGMRFEPPFALTDGTSMGLIYKKFLSQAPNFLKEKGVILLEIDPSLKENLKDWTSQYLLGKKIKFHRDFSRRWRFAEIL